MAHSIVIIDDEPWIAIDLKENINWKDLGYKILNALYDPSMALKYICEENPDVVIVDIQMPSMDGLTLIQKAQENGCTSLFVILTAYKDFSFAQNALRLNVKDYIVKPIDPQEIIRLFSRLKPLLAVEESQEEELPPSETGKFHDILNYLDEHLDQKLTLQQISDTFFLNRNYICNLFRRELDCTFSHYLTELRLKKARAFLLHTNLTITEISARCGFSDEFYFNKVFKKSEGISPGLYRQLKKTGDS